MFVAERVEWLNPANAKERAISRQTRRSVSTRLTHPEKSAQGTTPPAGTNQNRRA